MTLPDTSHLKLTIQEYRLRDGISIQQTGVIPDLELLPHSVSADGDEHGTLLVPSRSGR